ncbi:MAG: hypothetical protein WCJ49_01600, partial [Deltaproteobacteria bacterium]
MVVAVLVKKHFYPHSLGDIMLKYKKSILMVIAITLMQVSTVYAANYSISGTVSGPLTNTTLAVTVQPDIMLPAGTPLSLFVIGYMPNDDYMTWYYMLPSGKWTPQTQETKWSDIISYAATTTATPPMPITITPIYSADVSGVAGAVIFVGYDGPNLVRGFQPVAVIPNATVNEPISYPKSFAPSNWPNHIAMGSAMDTMHDIPYFANIEAINKYATGDGAPGQIVAPRVINSLIDDAYELSNLQMSHTDNYYSVRPVLVEYTANGSQSLEILQADFTLNNMAMHFINLMKDCNAIGAQSSTNTSIILNPDLLGEIEQFLFTNASAANKTNPNFIANVINSANANTNATNLLVSGCTANCSLKVIEALKIAVYFINNKPDSTSQADFATAVANYTSVTKASVNNNTASVSLPTVTEDFAGYIQAINWIVKNYAPKANFGWHSNIRTSYDTPWLGLYDGLWTHTIPNSSNINAYASVISTFWNSLGIYTGSYKPDFIVFDKYGVNGLSSYVSTFSNGYLFNQQDMKSYFGFVKAITTKLGVPAMLWQIPGGHIGADVTNQNTMSTEAQFLFGDKRFSTANVPSGPLSTYYRSHQKVDTAQFLNSTCGSNNSACDWSSSNLAMAENSNVFAILWGTGTRSTSIGTYPGGDQLDGGWLLGKVNEYYTAPFFQTGE